MDSFKALEKLYGRWLLRNKYNCFRTNTQAIIPLISADDLLYDHHCGNITLSNIQEKWIRKFINVWEKSEDYRNRYNDRIEGDQGMTKEQLMKRLKDIMRIAKEYEIDADSQNDGYEFLMGDLEKLVGWNVWEDEK
jgi:adenine-specific DNA methylase